MVLAEYRTTNLTNVTGGQSRDSTCRLACELAARLLRAAARVPCLLPLHPLPSALQAPAGPPRCSTGAASPAAGARIEHEGLSEARSVLPVPGRNQQQGTSISPQGSFQAHAPHRAVPRRIHAARLHRAAARRRSVRRVRGRGHHRVLRPLADRARHTCTSEPEHRHSQTEQLP